jgi:hypothetical protein
MSCESDSFEQNLTTGMRQTDQRLVVQSDWRMRLGPTQLLGETVYGLALNGILQCLNGTLGGGRNKTHSKELKGDL